jgi:outer membrane protein assembly factor BamB
MMTIPPVQRIAPVFIVMAGLAATVVFSLWQALLPEIDNTNSPLNFAVLPPAELVTPSVPELAENQANRTGDQPSGLSIPQLQSLTSTPWQIRTTGLSPAPPLSLRGLLVATGYDSSRQRLEVRAFDQASGEPRWVLPITSDKYTVGTFNANPLVTDGQWIFVPTVSDGYCWLQALDLQGQLVWKCRIAPASDRLLTLGKPLVLGSLVVVTCEPPHPGRWLWSSSGFAVAVHRRSGELIWRIRKPTGPATACEMGHSPGQFPLLYWAAAGKLAAIDARTGRRLSSVPIPGLGTPQYVVASNRAVVVQQQLIDTISRKSTSELATFSLSVVSTNAASAAINLAPDWQAVLPEQVPYPAMIRNNELFLFTPGGVLYSYRFETGDALWTRRLAGTFNLPPCLQADHLLAVNNEGTLLLVPLADTTAVVRSASLTSTMLAGVDGLACPPLAIGAEYIMVGHGGLMSFRSPFGSVSASQTLKPVANAPTPNRARN